MPANPDADNFVPRITRRNIRREAARAAMNHVLSVSFLTRVIEQRAKDTDLVHIATLAHEAAEGAARMLDFLR